MQEFRIFRALGLSFQAWFRNFIPFTLLAAVLYAPAVLWISLTDLNKASSIDDLVNMVFVRPVYIMVGLSTLLAPLLTYRVIQELNGAKVPLWTSISFGLRGVLPALILAVITNVLQLIPVGGIVGAVLMCMWFVAAPSAVAEKLGPFAAMARSSELTRGRRWGIFGLNFLIGLAFMGMLMIWIFPMMKAADVESLSQIKRSGYICLAVTGVFQMFIGIVEAVSYVLLRQDKEGVTHEQLAAVFE